MSINPPSSTEREPSVLAEVIRQLCEGRSNATGTLTLTANVTTTAVAAVNCAPGSTVQLTPATANAAAALATTYVLASNIIARQFTVTHANTATTDRTFYYAVLG